MFESTTESTRMMNAKVGFVLAAVITIALLAVRHIVLMLSHPHRLPHESLTTILIVILCAAGILQSTEVPLRLAFAMAGTQAAVRAALWLAGAPRTWRWIAAISGEMLMTLAAIMAIFVIVKWLIAANSEHPSDRETPAS